MKIKQQYRNREPKMNNDLNDERNATQQPMPKEQKPVTKNKQKRINTINLQYTAYA